MFLRVLDVEDSSQIEIKVGFLSLLILELMEIKSYVKFSAFSVSAAVYFNHPAAYFRSLDVRCLP